MKLWFREKKKYLCLTKGDKDMQSTVFNNAQMELLDMMSFVDTPEMLAQLKQAISDFFARRAEEEIDRLWETGALDEQKVENFRNLHERTLYN